MTTGERIKAARKEKKMTQTDLADATNLSQMSIRRYETDNRQPRLEQLQAIAEALGVSTTYLIHGVDKEMMRDMFLSMKGKADENAPIIRYRPRRDGTMDVDRRWPNPDKKMQEVWEGLNRKGKNKTIEYATDLAKADEYRAAPAADAPDKEVEHAPQESP